MNLCKDCISRDICGNQNVTGCISYTKQDENFLPINCYVCNGSGWIAGNAYRHVAKCGRCNGTGRINYKTLTKYDWLKMASEKELAKWIARIVRDTIKCTRGNTKYTENVVSAEWWSEWLKQPHQGE
jgi:hypothetical protein